MVRAIRDSDNGATEKSNVTFTAATATKMLPLVRRIVDDLLRLDGSIKAQREQLRGVDQWVATIDQPDYQDELSDIRQSLVNDQQRFDFCMGELTSLGLSPHLPFNGAIDFPAEISRRHVRLCWQPGEEQVSYWHEIDAPLESRQKI